MCGINGIVSSREIHRIIKLMNSSTQHRGPDDTGIYFNKKNQVALGNNRLSILGAAEGGQPMVSNDKNYVIVFNGEIFNFKSLNKKFGLKNYSSDTKTLLELFAKFGLDSLDFLNGMFAFAIYDLKKNQIYLIRDRYGIKPLYFYFNNDFIFSSEIKAIKKSLNNSLELNLDTLSKYITLNHSFHNRTIYKKVYKLEAGSYLLFDVQKKKIDIKKWYYPKKKRIFFKQQSDCNLLIKEQIKKSVKLWTKSDVPIAFSLSGGTDSGVLANLYAEQKINKVNTFSLNFEGFGNKWDETESINGTVNKIKSNHQSILFNSEKFYRDFQNIFNSLDEPYGGGLPVWLITKEISKKFKVAITGTGGDELFGNYNRYYRFKEIKSKSFKTKFKKYFDSLYAANNKWKKKYIYQKFNRPKDVCLEYFKKLNSYNLKPLSKSFSYLDLDTQLTNEFLPMSDLLSMKHSVELRTPFLDHELVELVYSLPEKFRISSKTYKPILYDIVKSFKNIESSFEAKKGFSLPLSLLMRKSLRPLINKYFCRKNLKKHGLIRPEFAEDYVQPMLKGKNENIQLIWNMLVLQMWFEKNIN